jgi:hypothetical protein
MAITRARFFSLLFVALALAPALAHLLELPNKIGLSREEYLTVQQIYQEYLTVQQIYRGWALLGVVVFGALLATLVHALAARGRMKEFRAAVTAFVCIVAAQVVFWIFTFPTNQATRNWTVLPDNWEALRTQWEYSHAAGALLMLGAAVALIHAAAREKG